MRIFGLLLALLVVLIQYPLWVGKGGWLRVWELDRQLVDRRMQNERLQARNSALEAEVRDLKNGLDAIEERARFELGMIRSDEVFILIPAAPPNAPGARTGEALR
jgi:cell division protein FtsB